MKEEALKLADEILLCTTDQLHSKTSAMIRRLVEELDKQGEPVAWMLTLPDGTHDWILDGNGCEGYIPLYTTPQTKPLSDEEIAKEWSKFYPDVFHTHLIEFARAIEERHGIK